MARKVGRNKYVDNMETEIDDDSDSDEDIDIHEIVRTGTLAEVKENLAKDRPRYIALKDQYGRTALHYAAMLDRAKIALHLIAKNANVNAKDNELMTPLHFAAANGLTEMCRFLLDFNANIRLKDTNCWTALHHAVDKNHYDTATLLIKRGAELNAEDHQFGRQPLHLAAERGFSKMCEMLIIRGADLYASGDAFYSKTPLHIACIHNHLETMNILIKRGSNLEALSGLVDKTPLHMVCELGYLDATNILLTAGANVNAQGSSVNGSSPLHLACENNHLAIADLLIQFKADIELLGKFTTQGTPLHVACMKGHMHIVYFLVNNGAKIDSVEASRHTPLHFACLHGHYDIAIYLIEQHANFRAKALNNKTPIDYIKMPTMKDRILIICAKMDKIHEMEELNRIKKIEAEKEHQKKMELLAAERRRQEEKARQEKADRTTNFKARLLNIVTISGEYNALLYLLESHADEDINIVLDDATGGNALTLSAKQGFYDLIKILVNVPVIQIDYQDYLKNTALHYAASRDCRDIVEELLLHGANNALLNQLGQVPANCTSHSNIREILRNPKLIHSRAQYRDMIVQDIYKALRNGPGEEQQLLENGVSSRDDGTLVTIDEEKSVLSLPYLNNPSIVSALTLGDDEMIGTPRKESSVTALPPIPLPAVQALSSPTRLAQIVNGPNQDLSMSRSKGRPLIQPSPHHHNGNKPADPFQSPSVSSKLKLKFDPYGNYPRDFVCDASDFFELKEIIEEKLKQMKTEELGQELQLLQSNQIKFIKNKFDQHHGVLGAMDSTSSITSALPSKVVNNLRNNHILINNMNIQKNIFVLQYSYLPNSFDETLEYLEKKNLLYFLGYPYAQEHHPRILNILKPPPKVSLPINTVTGRVENRYFLYCLGDLMDIFQGMIFTKEVLPTEFFSTMLPRYPNMQYYNFVYFLNHHPNAHEIPPTIAGNSKDKERCCALASLSLAFIDYYLRFYDDVYIDGVLSMYGNNWEQVVYAFFEQIQYLHTNQYIDTETAHLLCRLLAISHLKSSRRSSNQNYDRPEQSGGGEALNREMEEGDDDDDGFLKKDPLRALWSEVVLNPPRALRQTADLIFDLAGKMLATVESMYPQDFVRANMWYFKYCEQKKQNIEEKTRQRYAAIQSLSEGRLIAASNDEKKDSASLQAEAKRSVTSLTLWLFDMHLVEYEEMFVKLGFKLIEDFQGLSEDDCFRYFPFLTVGDRRRLCKHCQQMTLHMITLYRRKAEAASSRETERPGVDDTHSLVTI